MGSSNSKQQQVTSPRQEDIKVQDYDSEEEEQQENVHIQNRSKNVSREQDYDSEEEEQQKENVHIQNHENVSREQSVMNGDVNHRPREDTEDSEDDTRVQIEDNISEGEDPPTETTPHTHRSQSENTTKPAEEAKWKLYHKDLRRKMYLESVRDAAGAKDRYRLQKNLADCEQIPELNDHKDVIKGKHTLKVLTARDDLRSAMYRGDIEDIRREIDSIKSAGLSNHLQQAIIEAEHTIDQIERQSWNQSTVLAMDRKTMSEIRRYHTPPKMMHRIIQAALLLLGEDELTTSYWSECQRVLNPQGNSGMSKKVMEFKAESVQEEIWARSKFILTEELYDTRTGEVVVLEKKKGKPTNNKKQQVTEKERTLYWRTYDLNTLQKVSPAAATFFVWAMGIIDSCENNYDYSYGDPTPADIPRQLQLFDRINLYKNNPQISPRLKKKVVMETERYLQRDANDRET